MPKNLARLWKCNLGRKLPLALRGYALGLESIPQCVAGEPLRRIHEAVFAALALEARTSRPTAVGGPPEFCLWPRIL